MKCRRCSHCRCAIKLNRNPNQRYCSSAGCQTVRKRKWRQEKHRTDPDYCENQRRAAQAWRQKNLDYMTKYRVSHPEYVAKNRAQMNIKIACKKRSIH